MIRDRNACFKASLLVIAMIFVVSVVKYPIESSKFYYGESRGQSEVQGERIAYRKIFLRQPVVMKLSETALPARSLKSIHDCVNKNESFKIVQHGEFWILRNYIKASNFLLCNESITITTHGDVSYVVPNLIPLLERWQNPVSIAVWAPGEIFDESMAAILFLRNCHPQNSLVKQFATFHIFFEAKIMPNFISQDFGYLEANFTCPADEPSFGEYFNEVTDNLEYPINVGRNLARDAATTHFIFANDIELYPSPGLVDSFFAMLKKTQKEVAFRNEVFVLPIFEVAQNHQIPQNKSKLLDLFRQEIAVWFHSKICPACHTIPSADKWVSGDEDDETDLKVFTTMKRQGRFDHWEPLFIGTNDEPLYDERLSWDGKSDKMTQAYIMCLLDYDFSILSNAFLVHKPGIKTFQEASRLNLETRSKDLILKTILKEIDVLYGRRHDCKI